MRTTSLPSAKVSGVQCAPTSAPTARASGRRRRAPAARAPSRWSATSRSTWAPSSWGSRSSGWAPETLASAGRSRRLARRRRAAGVEPAVARVDGRGPGRGRRPGGARRPAASAQPSRVTSPSATTNRTPASAAGTSSGTAAVTSTCSAPATRSASCARRSVSSSAKTSSRIRIGSSPSAAEQVVRRQPERQRERPGLAVAGVALHRQPRLAPSAAPGRGPARAAGRRGAGRPARCRGRARPCGAGRARRGSPLGRAPSRSSGHRRLVLDLGVVARRPAGHGLVGLADVGPQVVDQRQPGREQLGAVPGELLVPDAASRARASCDELPRRAAPAVLSSELRCLSTRS